MSFPPLHPTSHSSIASPASHASGTAPSRSRPSPWGPSTQTSSGHRSLTPLATHNLGGTSESERRTGTSSGPLSPSLANHPSASASPFGAPSFSSILNANPNSRLHNLVRTTSTSASSSAPSPFSPAPQPGSQSALQLASPRSRANTPSSSSNLTTSAASDAPSASQTRGGGSSGGGGGSGSTARPSTFSPSLSTLNLGSPTNSAFDRTPFTPSASSASGQSGQSSVSKIVVTQVFILLSNITEKEGKQKWDTQAEAIRKLVYSNGMEVFAKYFRRLVQGNSPSIFPGTGRNVENQGNYQLLVQEMEKVTQDPDQAKRIVEALDTNEGDFYRDFDLEKFINHFHLDSIGRTLLAAAFTQVSRVDLRNKGASILVSNSQHMLLDFSKMNHSPDDWSPALMARTAYSYLRDLPEGSRDGTERDRVQLAFQTRYTRIGLPIPNIIRSALALTDILSSFHELANDLQNAGPSATASVAHAKNFLLDCAPGILDEQQVSGVLLFMSLTPDWQQHRIDHFVSAVREIVGSSFNWQAVVRGLDRSGIALSGEQFLALYNALLPIAQDDSSFDIQQLWGGRWRYSSTQLSFALAFASLTPSQLDATTIPGLRLSHDPGECSDGPPEVTMLIDEARRDTMISQDAAAAIFNIVWDEEAPPAPEDQTAAKEVVNSKMELFLCSAAGVPKPWSPKQTDIMSLLLSPVILKQIHHYSFVLHSLWKQDKHWLAMELNKSHLGDPLRLPVLLEHAQTHGWLEDLLTMMNGFGLDLAALAHRENLVDIHEWAQDKLTRPNDFAVAISRFLMIKTEDEMRTAREEQIAPRTVSLAMKTVYALLNIFGDNLGDNQQMVNTRQELLRLGRSCLQAFPRLINYGEGFDDIIELNGVTSNRIPKVIDGEMQELYKKMYGAELEVRDIIEKLSELKTSKELGKQDLFCCMIHGLFDEYACFDAYPLAPLATTAVLFGGIISYQLIAGLTLHVALDMVLESVKTPPEQPMYKFGLQALINFQDRLREWPEFAQDLMSVPGLQGTSVFPKIQEIAEENAFQHGSHGSGNNVVNGVNGVSQPLTNGTMDERDQISKFPDFESIAVDPLPEDAQYEDPDETVQDKVLFALNNVTEENMEDKTDDMYNAINTNIHAPWLASQIVDQRARLQPNYHNLYLEVLGFIDDKQLWAEVLRATYEVIRRTLNSETIVSSTTERAHLRNLGTWLGNLTIARDQPIKQKNLSFKDLLIEGWQTERLLVVIPFTCAVLQQGAKSIVFKPPNPWLMDTVRLLLEFHAHPDTKTFAIASIESMLSLFGFPRDGKGLEPSTELQRITDLYQEAASSTLQPDGVNGFSELALGGLNKGVPNAKFSQSAIAASLPSLDGRLTFPPLSGPPAQQRHIMAAVVAAVTRAIEEIAAPVVERSVAIATIATKALVTKDFSRESDEEKVRQAAQTMGRVLAGSLALVTSKEPMKISMSNNIRTAQAELPDPSMIPEGSILMMINDNLDIACGILENLAEERAVAEIDNSIEADILARRQHKQDYPNEPYRDPIYNPWSSYIPDPYKQTDGVGQEQIEIYYMFARQTRGPASHVQTASTDSGRQIPDVLQQDPFPSVPNLANMSTASDTPSLSQQSLQSQQNNHGRMLPPPSSVAPRLPGQMNGYSDFALFQQAIPDRLAELNLLASEVSEARVSDLTRDSPILAVVGQIQQLIVNSSSGQDEAALFTASAVCANLYSPQFTALELDVTAQLLRSLCQMSLNTAKEVTLHLRSQDDERIFNVPVTAALLEAQLLEFSYVDTLLAKAVAARRIDALGCLAALMDVLLFTENPIALRADFATSLGALGQWLYQQPDLPVAQDILSKLQSSASVAKDVVDGSSSPDDALAPKQYQAQYMFAEWLALYHHPQPTDGMFTAFIMQVHRRELLDSQHDMVRFLRVCIEAAVEAMEHPELAAANPLEACFPVDALARFVVLLVRNQGETNGVVRGSKAAYMNSILSLTVLILNNHHVGRGEEFSQRTFYRLLSSVLYDWQEFGTAQGAQGAQGAPADREMSLVFARVLQMLEPGSFPGFTYGWLGLVSHRAFMSGLLRWSDDECYDAYTQLIQSLFSYTAVLLHPSSAPASSATSTTTPTTAAAAAAATTPDVAKDLYRGVLRILLILHHDFAEFLADNHVRLCNALPARLTQLRNLVLSAFPASLFELPDPFTTGLKVDRLEEVRRSPRIAGDHLAPLERGGAKDWIDVALRSSGSDGMDEPIAHLATIIATPLSSSSSSSSSTPEDPASPAPPPTDGVDATLLHSLVLYLATSALHPKATPHHAPTFAATSPQAAVLTALAARLAPPARFHLLGAVLNQLRYPNAHTHYFSLALLHLYSVGDGAAAGGDGGEGGGGGGGVAPKAGEEGGGGGSASLREQISRSLLERLTVHRPHPWGLIVVLLELMKNPAYGFWAEGFVKDVPEVKKMFEALFDSLTMVGGAGAGSMG